jgi:hypothetical protein
LRTSILYAPAPNDLKQIARIIYAFLNVLVAPVDVKTMPVILMTPEENDIWTRAP